MQGDPGRHVLVGEASGVNKAGGCPEGVSPFVATVGVWQRLTTPASALRSGVVEARVAAWRRLPTAAGISSETPLATKNPSSNPVDARKNAT